LILVEQHQFLLPLVVAELAAHLAEHHPSVRLFQQLAEHTLGAADLELTETLILQAVLDQPVHTVVVVWAVYLGMVLAEVLQEVALQDREVQLTILLAQD
jgi:hypothetical protein